MPDDETSHPLTDAFIRAAGERAERRVPDTPSGAMSRYGWTTADIAERMGVSQRTARRWRQFNRVPERRQRQWKETIKREATSRQRNRIERRGLGGLQVTGTYLVNGKYRYKARPDMPVRLRGDNRIQGSTMRDVFKALDDGRADEAEDMLNDALAEGYEMDGGGALSWEDIDSLGFDIG